MNYFRDKIELNDCLLHENDSTCPLVTENESKLWLSWENVTVRTNGKSNWFVEKILRLSKRSQSEATMQESIEILTEASGYAEAGNMIAVMGPSGAGKTTLLSVLARKIQPTTGTILINGVEISDQIISKVSSYVPQFDPLPTTLTVMEYMAFSCALRLDDKSTARQREILSKDIVLKLGLYECKDTFICLLSGGEKKRLSLAAEIVTKPQILYLDEPTTGLDTSAALRVIESVKLVSTNCIVICSIHQPSLMIYQLFSHVIFLSNGKTAFSGSLKDARLFFQSEGFQCPIGFDEAEYYLKILSSNRSSENCDYLLSNPLPVDEDNSTRICRAYANSFFSKIPESHKNPREINIRGSQKGPRWIVQFNWLLWRLYLENRRSFLNGLIAFQYYAISIVFITIFFWGIDTRKQRGVQDVMGLLYIASSEAIFSTAYTPLYEIECQIPLYQREKSMYGSSAYYLATAVSWIPKAALKAFLLSISLFSLLGTRTTFCSLFPQFCLSTIASGICGTAYGSMIASFIEDNEIATAVMVPLDLVGLMMAGVYYSLRTLKWYTVGFKYFSIFYYTTEALAIAHWSKVDEIECDSDEDLPCISTGSQVMLQYGYEESNFWIDVLGLVLLTIFMNFIGYLGARRRRAVKSRY